MPNRCVVDDISPDEAQTSSTAKAHLQKPTWLIAREIEHSKIDILVRSPADAAAQLRPRLKLEAVEVDNNRTKVPVHVNHDGFFSCRFEDPERLLR